MEPRRSQDSASLFNEEDVRRFWRRLGHDLYGVTELKALKINQGRPAGSGYFLHLDNFVRACKEMNGRANLYAGRNPRPLDLGRRCSETLGLKTKVAKDGEIQTLTHLSIDIDPVRPKGLASTDDELKLAVEKAHEIVDATSGASADMTGNGTAVDLPIEPIRLDDVDIDREFIRKACKAFEEELRQRHLGSENRLMFDPVSDLIRGLKVIGTLSVKGDNTPERPHRLTSFITEPCAAPIPGLREHILELARHAAADRRVAKVGVRAQREDNLGGASGLTEDLLEKVEVSLCPPMLRILHGDLDGNEDRSLLLHNLTQFLAAKAYSDAEILAVVLDADSRIGKFTGRQDQAREYVTQDLAEIREYADQHTAGIVRPPCPSMRKELGYDKCLAPAMRATPYAAVKLAMDNLATLPDDDAQRERLQALIDASSFMCAIDQERFAAALKQMRPLGMGAAAINRLLPKRTRGAAGAGATDADAGEEDHGLTNPIVERNGIYLKRKVVRAEVVEIPLSTFVHRPERIVETEEGEIVEGGVVAADGTPYGDVTMCPEDWTSASKYRQRLCRHGRCSFTGGDHDVQHLMQIVHWNGTRRVPGTTVVGLHLREGVWFYVDTNDCITSSPEPTAEEFVFCSPWQPPVVTDILRQAAPDKEALRLLADLLPRFNGQDVTALVMGWMAACLIKPRLKPLVSQGFPSLMLHGPRGSGKSKTQENITRPFFAIRSGALSARKMTEFTLLMNSSGSNNMPMTIEEFKPSRMPKQAPMIESLLRDSYDGHVGNRGRKDLSMRRYVQQAPIIVAGEERPTEPAIWERQVIAIFSKQKSRPHKSEFESLIRQPLGGLGRLVLEHGLRIADERLINTIEEESREVNPRLQDRVRGNAIHTRVGLRLLEATLLAQGLTVDYSGLRPVVDSTMEANVLEGRSDTRSVVDSILEEFAAQAARQLRYEAAAGDENKRRELQRLLGFRCHYSLISNGTEIAISIRDTYPEFKEWARRTNYDGEVPDKGSFITAMQQEPYYRGARTARIDEQPGHAHILDYQAMLQKGMEVEGFLGGPADGPENGNAPKPEKAEPDEIDEILGLAQAGSSKVK